MSVKELLIIFIGLFGSISMIVSITQTIWGIKIRSKSQ